MNRQIKIGVAMVVVLSALAYLIYVGIQTGSMYFLSVSEFTAQRLQLGDENVRINGNVVPGSVKFNTKNLDLSFTLQDEATKETLNVKYRGPKPDLIEQAGISLVAEGAYDSQEKVFAAHNLLVKCPSKYEGKEEYEEKYNDEYNRGIQGEV
ncbi:MAG: cytochrome c maturation protein CcmE [Thermodesulfobacteriota bacterium]